MNGLKFVPFIGESPSPQCYGWRLKNINDPEFRMAKIIERAIAHPDGPHLTFRENVPFRLHLYFCHFLVYGHMRQVCLSTEETATNGIPDNCPLYYMTLWRFEQILKSLGLTRTRLGSGVEPIEWIFVKIGTVIVVEPFNDRNHT